MNIIDLATKTMQTAIKTVVDAIKVVVDAIKTTTDATKTKVDTIDTRTNTINTNVSAINTNVAAVKTTVDSTKSVVDATKANIDTLLAGRVIKSIQKGVVNTGATSLAQYIVPIAQINANKAFVLLDGTKPTAYSGAYPLLLKELNSSQIVIKPAQMDVNYGYDFSWQVIEFY